MNPPIDGKGGEMEGGTGLTPTPTSYRTLGSASLANSAWRLPGDEGRCLLRVTVQQGRQRSLRGAFRLPPPPAPTHGVDSSEYLWGQRDFKIKKKFICQKVQKAKKSTPLKCLKMDHIKSDGVCTAGNLARNKTVADGKNLPGDILDKS